MPGSLTNSSMCTTDNLSSQLAKEDAEVVQWNYLTCPAENECLNGHHTCNYSVETCVDQKIGVYLYKFQINSK